MPPSVGQFDFIKQKYQIEFTPKQLLALWLLNQKYTQELLYGGAWLREEAKAYFSADSHGFIAMQL